jgi:hypothetical protein
MSGKGRSKLKLSGDGNECKPLVGGLIGLALLLCNADRVIMSVAGRGLHSSTFVRST